MIIWVKSPNAIDIISLCTNKFLRNQGDDVWQKSNHDDFVYFWVDHEKKLTAAVDAGGRFIVWSENGRYDAVQCDNVDEALKIMEQASRGNEYNK